MMRFVALLLLSSCTLGYNAAHPHTHLSHAAMEAEADDLRAQGHRKMAAKLERDWDATVSAPMYCMLGDMGLLIGGAGALSAAQSLERSGRIRQSWVEPINVTGLAISAAVFVALGVSLKIYGHL